MKLFKRGTRLDKVLAAHDLTEATIAAQQPAVRYERVRAIQGRKAHLRAPGSSPGVLCGWPGPWVPAADPSLPVCRMCEDRSEGRSDERKAS